MERRHPGRWDSVDPGAGTGGGGRRERELIGGGVPHLLAGGIVDGVALGRETMLRQAVAIAATAAVQVASGCGGNTTKDPAGAEVTDPTGGDGADDPSGSAGAGAAGPTAGAAGSGGAGDECVAPKKQPGCFGTPICPSYWCPEAQHLRVERLSDADCVFVITEAGLPEVVAYDDYQVALVLPARDGFEETTELLSSLGGVVEDCALRLTGNDEAWLFGESTDPLTVTVCPCVCDRMGQEGWLDVVRECGTGPQWTG